MRGNKTAGRPATARQILPHRVSVFGLAAAFALAGCTVGPNYSRPPVVTPTAWKEPPPEGWKTASPQDDISKGNWWEVFGDPQLNDLETQAIAANQTLRAAAEAVIQARDVAKITRSSEFPFVFLAPSAGRARSSGNRPVAPGSAESAFSANTFTVPADASYLVDIWGQVRRSVESANAQTQVSVATYENVLLTLKSDVAEFYIMTRFIDEEGVILRNNMQLQQQALKLTEDRHAGGVSSGLDVAEAETQLDTTNAGLIGLGVQRAQFEHALAVLLGKPPAEFSLPENPLNLKPPAIPPGLPSDLLERRPDIAAAERAMASNNALIGVARSAYFPSVALTASGGYLSSGIGSLFNATSAIWSAAAGAAQPLYTGGRLSANLERSRAVYDQSVASYREQVLTAFEQVEDGLSGLRVLEEQASAYDKAIQSAQQTVDISTSRYKEGLANYLEVITAQNTLLGNQRVGDQIMEQRLLTTVELIQALGGGWQESKIYSSSTATVGTPAQPSAPPPSAPGPSQQ